MNNFGKGALFLSVSPQLQLLNPNFTSFEIILKLVMTTDLL